MRTQPAQVAARYETLLSGLADEGRIDVAAFASRLGVTQETIRRDLRALEVDGKLLRVYGGAVAVDVVHSLPVVPPTPAVPDDEEFGREVWARLPRTGTVALGSGTLAAAVARAAAADPPEPPGLTVVTTSLDAAVSLSRGAPSLAVYLIGGTVSAQTGGQEGQWALDELARFQVDVAVVSAPGVDIATGLGATSTAAAAVDAAVLATARRAIALVCAEHLGRPAFVQFADLDQIEVIMVHGEPSPGVLKAFRDRNVDLEIIPRSPA